MSGCKPEELQPGDVVSSVAYFTVKKVDPKEDFVRVVGEDGKDVRISKSIVEGYDSSSQFDREEAVTRTQMVEHLAQARDSVFSVAFQKQPTAKDVADAAATTDPKARAKKVREAMKGKRRVLQGYTVQQETGMGRTTVIDMDAGGVNKQARTRQIDHRTLEYLILRNVKYIIK